MIKLMTLNLWGYYDWGNRKDHIIALIQDEAPDCIALQEVHTNRAFSDYPQSDFIADACGYKFRFFAPTYARPNQIDKAGNRTQRTSYGLAFLSKHPVISSETYFLNRYPDHDEECSVQFCRIEPHGVPMDVCNVHFANSDKHSDLHLKELVGLCQSRNLEPIILGDFNNFHLNAYEDTQLKGYTISASQAEYTSMPKDNGTLDYIVVPKAKYRLENITCPEMYVSDHRALLAKVSRK